MAMDVPQGWFEKFSKQMKEQFKIDLTQKEDLMRIVGIFEPENEDDVPQTFFPFMERKEGEYVTPKPQIALDDFLEIHNLYMQEGEMEDTDEKYQALHEERIKKANAIMEDRTKWLVENQTVIDPKKPEHEAMIQQLYELAKEGRLILNDPYVAEKNKQIYVDELDIVHSIESGDVGFYGKDHNPPEFFLFTGPDKSWREKHFPGDTTSHRDEEYTKPLPVEPEPVPKPGVGSWLKRIFSFGIVRSDFVRYDKYLQDKQQYEIDRVEIPAYNQKVLEKQKHRHEMADKAEQILIEEYDTYKGVSNADRRAQLLKNAKAIIKSSLKTNEFEKDEILAQMDSQTREETMEFEQEPSRTVNMLNGIANSKALKLPQTLIFEEIGEQALGQLQQHFNENNLEAATEDLGILMVNRLMERRFIERKLSMDEMRDKDAVINEGKKVCKEEHFKELFANKAAIQAILDAEKTDFIGGIEKALDKKVILKYNEAVNKSKAPVENDAPQNNKVVSADDVKVIF